MNEQNKSHVASIIELNHEFVSFGWSGDAVGPDWIKKAEDRIGLEFSPSYRWFLDNYAGGEISGEEIYSVYGVDFDTANGGDIVYHHLVECRNGVGAKDRLTVSATDMGEIFFFDYSIRDADEVPIKMRLPSGEVKIYAQDFYDFIEKRILAYSRKE